MTSPSWRTFVAEQASVCDAGEQKLSTCAQLSLCKQEHELGI